MRWHERLGWLGTRCGRGECPRTTRSAQRRPSVKVDALNRFCLVVDDGLRRPGSRGSLRNPGYGRGHRDARPQTRGSQPARPTEPRFVSRSSAPQLATTVTVAHRMARLQHLVTPLDRGRPGASAFGTKRSQVQILSPRPHLCRSETPPGAGEGVSGRQYSSKIRPVQQQVRTLTSLMKGLSPARAALRLSPSGWRSMVGSDMPPNTG